MNLKERIEEEFWDYLHTVIFAHNNQPNEPHRQVIFKQEIPELISDILKVVRKSLPKKKPMLKLPTAYRFGKSAQHGIWCYNQAIDDMKERLR